jgi:hypothetical protein
MKRSVTKIDRWYWQSMSLGGVFGYDCEGAENRNRILVATYFGLSCNFNIHRVRLAEHC